MAEFKSIETVTKKIKNSLDSNSEKKKVSLLYAFNSTGKTRISKAFCDLAVSEVLCYNAFVEDIFKWDNEKYILNFDSESWIANLIYDQGLENIISKNFSNLINSKIEPYFDFKKGEITFNIATGDKSGEDNVKISKGEESMFIWSIFYTLLEAALDELNNDADDRSTDAFDNIKYIIIDDPVSSIDDTKIITLAIELIRIIDNSENKGVRFFITTHHALFYNVLYTSFNTRYRKKEYNISNYVFKKTNSKYVLEKNRSESPFGYHLMVINEIEHAITNKIVKKYHFNLFRTVLEKTANFLGYGHWGKCVVGSRSQEFIKKINVYSHDRLNEFENKELPSEDITLFEESFNSFIKKFNWKVEG